MKRIHAGVICSLVLFLVFSLSGALTARSGEGALDGKTFTGDMGEAGKKGEKDELVFKDGKFSSVGCRKYGFGAAPYTTAEKDGSTTFEAVTTSAKEGKMEWSGTVTGDELAGTATWYKEGQSPVEYWFKTRLKK